MTVIGQLLQNDMLFCKSESAVVDEMIRAETLFAHFHVDTTLHSVHQTMLVNCFETCFLK